MNRCKSDVTLDKEVLVGAIQVFRRLMGEKRSSHDCRTNVLSVNAQQWLNAGEMVCNELECCANLAQPKKKPRVQSKRGWVDQGRQC